jgi:teichuronic acid biosynthesis glycosyltransferase TuaC
MVCSPKVRFVSESSRPTHKGIETLRIALVTPVFPTHKQRHRGIYIYNTARSLQRHADVDVVCSSITYPLLRAVRPEALRCGRVDLNDSPKDVHVRYLDYPGFPVITRPLNSISCCSAIRSHVKSLGPDLILAYWTHPEGNAAIQIGRELDIPVIVGALGSDLLLAKGLGRYLATRAVTTADYVLTVSEGLRRAAISFGAPAGRVKTIPNGSDRSIFYLRDRSASRAKLGINPGVRLVLFVGWLTPLKGVPELVAAFARVRREVANAELVCIGEGPLKQFVSSTPRADRVRALSHKTSEEIADWLGACDLLCLPSCSEGCPNVVVEALSSGRPVIGTQVGGIPELVDDRSGILVPPRDVARLASAICEGLNRKWNENAIAARMGRSWDDVADETYSVCLEVLAERRRLAPSKACFVTSDE